MTIDNLLTKEHLTDSDINQILEVISKIDGFCIKHSLLPDYITKQEFAASELEEEVARRIVRMFEGVDDQFIKELERRGLLSGVPSEATRLIDDILVPSFNEMQDELASQGVESAHLGREEIVRQLNAAGIVASFTRFSDRTTEILRNNTTRSVLAALDSEKEFIRNTLVEGVRTGRGIPEISSTLQKEFEEVKRYKLDRIARTEIGAAESEGRDMTREEHRVPFKQWITSRDLRVRDTHIPLHGVVVRQEESFTVGGFSMRYPRDRSAPPSLSVNCRCSDRIWLPPKGTTVTSTPFTGRI